jgi:NAD(P)-dependent dehydrogenase (short-subunit alcohol dehydrogenase family)
LPGSWLRYEPGEVVRRRRQENALSITDMFRLDDKVALIPGGSGGIGSELARCLAGAGARVAIAGRSEEKAEAAAAKVEAEGSEALTVIGDMTSEADAERCVAETVDRFGSVDIVINAIGGGAGNVLHPAHEYPRDDWDWIFELNVRSALLPTQYAVRKMIEADRGGRILNISSVRGQLGIDAGYSAYVAAKGAIDALTRQEATEWAKYGITVNAISPTFVDTPQVAMLLDDPEFKAKIVSRIPIGRVGQPTDLFGAVLLFCSDASSFITGQILTIDGGLTATQ